MPCRTDSPWASVCSDHGVCTDPTDPLGTCVCDYGWHAASALAWRPGEDCTVHEPTLRVLYVINVCVATVTLMAVLCNLGRRMGSGQYEHAWARHLRALNPHGADTTQPNTMHGGGGGGIVSVRRSRNPSADWTNNPNAASLHIAPTNDRINTGLNAVGSVDGAQSNAAANVATTGTGGSGRDSPRLIAVGPGGSAATASPPQRPPLQLPIATGGSGASPGPDPIDDGNCCAGIGDWIRNSFGPLLVWPNRMYVYGVVISGTNLTWALLHLFSSTSDPARDDPSYGLNTQIIVVGRGVLGTVLFVFWLQGINFLMHDAGIQTVRTYVAATSVSGTFRATSPRTAARVSCTKRLITWLRPRLRVILRVCVVVNTVVCLVPLLYLFLYVQPDTSDGRHTQDALASATLVAYLWLVVSSGTGWWLALRLLISGLKLHRSTPATPFGAGAVGNDSSKAGRGTPTPLLRNILASCGAVNAGANAGFLSPQLSALDRSTPVVPLGGGGTAGTNAAAATAAAGVLPLQLNTNAPVGVLRGRSASGNAVTLMAACTGTDSLGSGNHAAQQQHRGSNNLNQHRGSLAAMASRRSGQPATATELAAQQLQQNHSGNNSPAGTIASAATAPPPVMTLTVPAMATGSSGPLGPLRAHAAAVAAYDAEQALARQQQQNAAVKADTIEPLPRSGVTTVAPDTRLPGSAGTGAAAAAIAQVPPPPPANLALAGAAASAGGDATPMGTAGSVSSSNSPIPGGRSQLVIPSVAVAPPPAPSTTTASPVPLVPFLFDTTTATGNSPNVNAVVRRLMRINPSLASSGGGTSGSSSGSPPQGLHTILIGGSGGYHPSSHSIEGSPRISPPDAAAAGGGSPGDKPPRRRSSVGSGFELKARQNSDIYATAAAAAAAAVAAAPPQPAAITPAAAAAAPHATGVTSPPMGALASSTPLSGAHNSVAITTFTNGTSGSSAANSPNTQATAVTVMTEMKAAAASPAGAASPAATGDSSPQQQPHHAHVMGSATVAVGPTIHVPGLGLIPLRARAASFSSQQQQPQHRKRPSFSHHHAHLVRAGSFSVYGGGGGGGGGDGMGNGMTAGGGLASIGNAGQGSFRERMALSCGGGFPGAGGAGAGGTGSIPFYPPKIASAIRAAQHNQPQNVDNVIRRLHLFSRMLLFNLCVTPPMFLVCSSWAYLRSRSAYLLAATYPCVAALVFGLSCVFAI